MFFVNLSAFWLVVITTTLTTADEFHSKSIKMSRKANTNGENMDYWMKLGKDELMNALDDSIEFNTNVAKNIIIFVGDGMSLPTQTAARIYKAQEKGRRTGTDVNGEESYLTFERFPHVALSKTYCVDAQTADSASTASAMFSGIKTNYYTVGFDNKIVDEDPYSEATSDKVETIFTWAQNAGKDTGFVTNTRLSHATPAGLYAHSAHRFWECDKDLPANRPSDVHDITWQLVNTDPGRRAKVVMGGGRSSFLPEKHDNSTKTRWDYEDDDWDCRRQDKQNLLQQFLNKSNEVPGFEGMKGVEVESRGQLLRLDVNEVDYLLGLFSWNYMKYEFEREVNITDESEPSLSEMTEVSIKMLSKNKNGFFLMVEGGNIDHAHHGGKAVAALDDTVAFDQAIEKALEMVDTEDTLIIVTADHGHTMSIGGYQTRGVDIRGLVDNRNADDHKPYLILSYANGEAFNDTFYVDKENVARHDYNVMNNYTEYEFRQPVQVPLDSETHSGADVGIFARGPFAHLFHRVHEQNYIAFVMAYSACIGPYANDVHCKADNNSSTVSTPVNFSIIVLMTIVAVYIQNHFKKN